jgi:hypothetical protein
MIHLLSIALLWLVGVTPWFYWLYMVRRDRHEWSPRPSWRVTMPPARRARLPLSRPPAV